MSVPLDRATASLQRRGTVAAKSAVITAVGIGGSVAAVFLSVGLWLGSMGFAVPGTSNGQSWTIWFVALGLATVLLPPFVGGAIWGWGTARIFDRPARAAAKTGALAFGGMVVLTAAPTDLTQLWLDDLPAWMPLDVHGYFTIVFMVEVGIVACVASWRLAKRIGAGDASFSVGVWTGAAAAVGFLIGSIVAVALGMRIYPWVRLSMVWAFLTALPFSTVAAGAALGLRLRDQLDEHPTPAIPTT